MRIRPNDCAFEDAFFGSNPLEFNSGAVKIGGHARNIFVAEVAVGLHISVLGAHAAAFLISISVVYLPKRALLLHQAR